MEELFQTFSVIDTYGEDLTAKTYITNPAIAREEEIKKLILVLLTPEKSGLLVGKAGIGKTAIVEGLAYLIQKNEVPVALQGYKIIKLNSTSLQGKITINGREEMVISLLMEEIKGLEKIILFIDEIHTLMGQTKENPMDLANILKPGLDRGDIKAIGATTTEEYETYVIRDRAFLRRFERIEVLEPSEAVTVQILLGTIPKIEKQTNCKFVQNEYLRQLLIESIVSATSEFKRVYGLSAMYPDISFSVLQASFSNALFENRNEVTILDVYNAIKTSKRIYPDSIVKELNLFREKFKKYTNELGIELPVVTVEEIKGASEYY
ncbi:MAG: AAA family ATPase [Tenericutes bacterium]|nr:AAA family ATPase [Mycoplasmatota bacterium]